PVYVTGKIYFDANSTGWKNFKTITFYLYSKADGQIIPWGSKKGNMKDEGNGIWSFDLSNYPIGTNYGCIFTADWGMQTCDLIIGPDNVGDTAYCPGDQVENNVDSNKRSSVVKWKSGKYGNPICITSIGNVIGDTFWKGEDAFSLMVEFLNDGIDNAVKFNGMTYAETISYVGRALGLDDYDIEMAIRESGRSFDWQGGYDPYYPYWFETTYLPDGTLCVTDYTATSDEVIIPEEIYGTPVTAVGDWAFANNKYIKSVEIPNTVTSIGKGAFYNCVSMTHAEIPSGVTEIKPNTFEKCLYLESVWIDGDVTAIGDEAFYDCRRLEYVRIPDALETVGDEAFYNCRSLRSLALPLGVTALGTKNAAFGLGVFENCRSLEKLVVPESVAAIGENAFESCPKLEIKGVKGSYTERFAKDRGVSFKNVGTVNGHAQIVGDVSQNNDLDVTDATLIQRIFAEFDDSGCFDDLTDPGVVAFLDVNGDGTVNIIDVTQIQRILAEF
ncbi:MAG: leucine-rich repeat protein, partial [Ruminococcus sp.]|nr:leucine-rich repeat protein [Ruminococcus sp.]